MRKEPSNILKECRDLISELNENSYFERYMQRPEPQAEEQQMPPTPEEEPTNEPPMEEPGEDEAQPKEDILARIRKAIIEGLAAYADNINDPVYQTLKKLFAIIDKQEEPQENEYAMNNK